MVVRGACAVQPRPAGDTLTVAASGHLPRTGRRHKHF